MTDVIRFNATGIGHVATVSGKEWSVQIALANALSAVLVRNVLFVERNARREQRWAERNDPVIIHVTSRVLSDLTSLPSVEELLGLTDDQVPQSPELPTQVPPAQPIPYLPELPMSAEGLPNYSTPMNQSYISPVGSRILAYAMPFTDGGTLKQDAFNRTLPLASPHSTNDASSPLAERSNLSGMRDDSIDHILDPSIVEASMDAVQARARMQD